MVFLCPSGQHGALGGGIRAEATHSQLSRSGSAPRRNVDERVGGEGVCPSGPLGPWPASVKDPLLQLLHLLRTPRPTSLPPGGCPGGGVSPASHPPPCCGGCLRGNPTLGAGAGPPRSLARPRVCEARGQVMGPDCPLRVCPQPVVRTDRRVWEEREIQDPRQEQPSSWAGCPVAEGHLLAWTAGISCGPRASGAGLDLCSFHLLLLPPASKFLPVSLASLICTMWELSQRIFSGLFASICL